MILKSNVLSTHISAKPLRLQGSAKYSPTSSYVSPTISQNGRICRRVSCVCGEWNLRRLIQQWIEVSLAQTHTMQSQS